MADKPIQEELLASFHQQFSENQNHLQTIFIQFLSAVLVILAGYGYVYTNTSSNADFFDVTFFAKTNTLESYAVLHLIGSFLIAQIILGLLITLILNIGYGFRRDQMAIYNIRQKYLGPEFQREIFGTKSFDPRNQSVYIFLPEFNRNFVYAMAVIQVLLLVSLLCFLNKAAHYSFEEHWFLTGFIFLPFIWTFVVYGVYWQKYKSVCHTDKSRL
ncbi:MAG TPA: hypothetical protein VFE53_18310 [Mucilaginibacter sp.]|nr:hypothetical protein [Mucilaginibacter sp.]